MSDARKQILQLLQDGTISADEAMELLQAVGPADDPEELLETVDDVPEALVGEVYQRPEPPNMDRFRRYWQIPFFIALGAFLIAGLGLRSIYQSTEGTITFWFVCVWSIFIFTFLLTALAFMSRRSTWLHVRVQDRDGKKFAISLPLPLGLAKWGVNIGRGFVPEEARRQLDMADGFIDAARQSMNSPGADPLVVDVDEEDGDRVQVYIG